MPGLAQGNPLFRHPPLRGFVRGIGTVHPEVVGSWERGLQSLCEKYPEPLSSSFSSSSLSSKSLQNVVLVLEIPAKSRRRTRTRTRTNRSQGFFTQALNGALRHRQYADAPIIVSRRIRSCGPSSFLLRSPPMASRFYDPGEHRS